MFSLINEALFPKPVVLGHDTFELVSGDPLDDPNSSEYVEMKKLYEECRNDPETIRRRKERRAQYVQHMKMRNRRPLHELLVDPECGERFAAKYAARRAHNERV